MKAVHYLGASLDPLGGEESHCILVGAQRVPLIYVPHLLKSIRNNLFKYCLEVSTLTKAITIAMTHTRYYDDSHTSLYLFTSLDTRKKYSLAPYQNHYQNGPKAYREAHTSARILQNVSVWLHRCLDTLSLLVKFIYLFKKYSSITNCRL